jgi:hypothetical protein
VGLDDRDALRMLRDAVDPALGSDDLIRRFYNRWFAIDISVRQKWMHSAPRLPTR